MSLSIPSKPKYPAIWSFTNTQMGVLTCMVASPGGTRMIIASNNSSMIVINPHTGQYQGAVSFESQFFVKAAVWYSENNLIVGCSNVTPLPTLSNMLMPWQKGFAVTMCSILKERLPEQIRALAVNLKEHTLAIGYGTTVALMNRENDGDGAWDHIERIPGSLYNRSGLVASLIYFPGPSDRLSLLILYTEAGFGVRKASGDFNMIPASTGTCRVGEGSIGPNGRTLAISTLDQTLVTYPLNESGPILAEKREYVNPEQVSQYPVVPVGITEDGLAFGGTTTGQVSVVSTQAEKVQTLIRHEDDRHIIRVILTIADKIIVGSTDPSNSSSAIKCYAMGANVAEGSPMNVTTIDATGFRITVTEAILGWRDIDCAWPTTDQVKHVGSTVGEGDGAVGNMNEDASEGKHDQKSEAKDKGEHKLRIHIPFRVMLVTGFVIVVMMLATTPPNAEPFSEMDVDSEGTALLKPTMERHNYWILYGIRYSIRYSVYQVTHWANALVRD
ncbi:hypothetical protein FRC11_008344 [Ceratobasidium sp. 423]|nr:hypothetical protein FRC11_008344 [Ceratobasidium sp. 423]